MKMRTRQSRMWGIGLAMFFVSPWLPAEPFGLDSSIEPLQLTLREDPDNQGVLFTSARGIVESTAEYLFVDGLSARRAVDALLVSYDPGSSLSLSVVKELWSEPGQTCETDAEGICSVKFRTIGDAGFRINGVAGTGWHLLIMAGPEVSMDALLPSPIFEARKADAARYEAGGTVAALPAPETSNDTNDGGGSGALIWIAGIGVVVLAIIAVLLGKLLAGRNRASSMVLPLLTVGTLTLLLAVAGDARAEANASDSESIDVDITELNEEIEAEAERQKKEREEAKKQINSAAKSVNTALKILLDAKNAYDRMYGDLSNCATITNPPGAPRIPSFCEGDAKCEACYASARTRFNEMRGYFEQLRLIYTCNKKAIDAAIKFGDSGSAVHGVTALAWQTIKLDIQRSVKGMQEAYDQKYQQFSEQLHDSMIEISRCEARYGVPDWYDRFGVVYFEFLHDKYKRAD